MLGKTEPSLRLGTLIKNNTSFLNYLEMKILIHKSHQFLLVKQHYLSIWTDKEEKR